MELYDTQNGENEIDFKRPRTRNFAVVKTFTLQGLEAIPVQVEVHLANGLPAFSIVGLAETVVRESKDRVRGALINSGFEFPAKRITVNLAPADLPKHGGRFDLPIALGILLATGVFGSPDRIVCPYCVGELALDGGIRAVEGVLPSVLAAKAKAVQMIIPAANQAEAGLVSYDKTYIANHLIDVCSHLVNKQSLSICDPTMPHRVGSSDLSLTDVKGQQQAKRALSVCAAGEHSLLLMGPPGTGKSMLAQRLPLLLPNLSEAQALEVASIRSISSYGDIQKDFYTRPVRNPHHSASAVALVGGGTRPKPGEISMAHHGILFLDEITEFSRAALEQLREPMETGRIHIARANSAVTFPARFLFIAACNPCPCGYFGDNTDRCCCSASRIDAYQSRLSGPLLDRIDLQVALLRPTTREIQTQHIEYAEEDALREQILGARQQQFERQGMLNSRLEGKNLEKVCRLAKAEAAFIATASERLNLSARAYFRCLRVARTIADMSGEKKIGIQHLSEALAYRG